MKKTPSGIDRAAPVVARRELPIRAPAPAVWALLTYVPGWPTWQPDIAVARALTPLTPGAVFHWRTGGVDVTSTVYAVDAPRSILWGGLSQGITALHEWTFTPSSRATFVVTEESWDGAPVQADADAVTRTLDRSLAQWLLHLKSAAELAAR
ncbi:SRPBCC family protein [Kitasatospora aureofaciens]|uniref:SRPBCC family protein n=1 Tax=Kitasatospora aureofaciens TaxID=1894 RepID=UPI000526F968|nr:SRPBCC family protein [Kitasatospora aureofaciens]